MIGVDPGYHGRRHERLPVRIPARTVGVSGEQSAVVQDISESGAAIVTEDAIFSNDQFVELHMEGHERMTGRVVRKFAGGYALKFDEDAENQAKMAEEIEKFRKLAGSKAFLEG